MKHESEEAYLHAIIGQRAAEILERDAEISRLRSALRELAEAAESCSPEMSVEGAPFAHQSPQDQARLNRFETALSRARAALENQKDA